MKEIEFDTETGEIRLAWFDSTGAELHVVIPRPTIGKFKAYLAAVQRISRAQRDEQNTEAYKGLSEEERTLRNLTHMQNLAVTLIGYSDHPELAAKPDDLPSYLMVASVDAEGQSVSLYSEVAKHWMRIPLPSGGNPTTNGTRPTLIQVNE